MKTMTFLRLGSVVAALLALALLPACEDTSVDTSALDSYFANNPYVSDPRTGPGSDVFINPSAATVSVVGQDLLFTASGGTPPYSWNVSSEANGSIVGRSNQGDYRATSLGNNNVIVYDVNGHAAIATITGGSASSFAITPASATIPTTAGNQVQFSVIGGQPPYTWSITFPELATISQDGLYTSKATADGTVNGVTVTDAAGNIASASVTHKNLTTLAISPPAATVLASQQITFTALGGSGTYYWQIANASMGTGVPAPGVSSVTFTYTASGTTFSNAVNTLTLTDSSGASATATITQN